MSNSTRPGGYDERLEAKGCVVEPVKVSDGKLSFEVLAKDVTLAPGARSLFDADGSAVMLHAMGDDYMTDFKVGDPFTKVDEGYTRLPGAGYEAVHPQLQGLDPEDYPARNAGARSSYWPNSALAGTSGPSTAIRSPIFTCSGCIGGFTPRCRRRRMPIRTCTRIMSA